MTPMKRTNAKSSSVLPPRNRRMAVDRKVVSEVRIVRDSVWLIGVVHLLREGLALGADLAPILAQPVVGHDGVVDRVADDRQQGGQHRERELAAREGERPQTDDDVVEDRDHGGHAAAKALEAHAMYTRMPTSPYSTACTACHCRSRPTWGPTNSTRRISGLPSAGSAASAFSIFGPSSSVEPVMPSDRRMMYSREVPNSWMMALAQPDLAQRLAHLGDGRRPIEPAPARSTRR